MKSLSIILLAITAAFNAYAMDSARADNAGTATSKVSLRIGTHDRDHGNASRLASLIEQSREEKLTVALINELHDEDEKNYSELLMKFATQSSLFDRMEEILEAAEALEGFSLKVIENAVVHVSLFYSIHKWDRSFSDRLYTVILKFINELTTLADQAELVSDIATIEKGIAALVALQAIAKNQNEYITNVERIEILKSRLNELTAGELYPLIRKQIAEVRRHRREAENRRQRSEIHTAWYKSPTTIIPLGIIGVLSYLLYREKTKKTNQ